ncbi:hypothetical protein Celgi_1310 [Cellulomonas gilvus ATCC 13127]|uniref:Uncharacterized protein n=1 Tax=Cellulomonas gilvus (strain ATCC 13127 / NRRL B-14078) TaxID=593907 RepID=F8A2H2_CELGA|nr:hypothetical protein Celgi_1310 [Cellulomonas gilvus ATCC 13127]
MRRPRMAPCPRASHRCSALRDRHANVASHYPRRADSANVHLGGFVMPTSRPGPHTVRAFVLPGQRRTHATRPRWGAGRPVGWAGAGVGEDVIRSVEPSSGPTAPALNSLRGDPDAASASPTLHRISDVPRLGHGWRPLLPDAPGRVRGATRNATAARLRDAARPPATRDREADPSRRGRRMRDVHGAADGAHARSRPHGRPDALPRPAVHAVQPQRRRCTRSGGGQPPLTPRGVPPRAIGAGPPGRATPRRAGSTVSVEPASWPSTSLTSGNTLLLDT